jgi:hypothetical protein
MVTVSTPAAASAARSGHPADPARVHHALHQDRIHEAIQLANRGVRHLVVPPNHPRWDPPSCSARPCWPRPWNRPNLCNFELVAMLCREASK